MSQVASASDDAGPRADAECWKASRPVTRKTVLLMLKPEFIDRAGEAQYRFCFKPDCSIVYFDGEDAPCFTTEHLRVRVGVKEREDPIPLCYCFDFHRHDMLGEIDETGATTIPQRVRALVKEGMCACAARNPSGACCLAEVNQVADNLMRVAAGEISDSKGEA